MNKKSNVKHSLYNLVKLISYLVNMHISNYAYAELRIVGNFALLL